MPGKLVQFYTQSTPEEVEVWELQFDTPEELAAARSDPEGLIRPLLEGLTPGSQIILDPVSEGGSTTTTIGCYHTLDCVTH